jgi:SAM-dependent methyltransferase
LAVSYQSYYERRSTVEEYLAFHYPDGDPLEALLGERTPPVEERFPFAVRGLWKGGASALDVGAAVGRTTFDLARDHDHVVGLDRAHALIAGARDVQRTGAARYRTQLEGDIFREHDVDVDAPSNAHFMVGDALALPFADAAFDTVVALNLIDRVPDAARALDELARVARGALIVSSPYTWLEEYAPKEKWLGGFLRNREPVRGIEAVKQRLGGRFTLQRELQLPFFMPHHARSGQFGVSLVLSFRRKQ